MCVCACACAEPVCEDGVMILFVCAGAPVGGRMAVIVNVACVLNGRACIASMFNVVAGAGAQVRKSQQRASTAPTPTTDGRTRRRKTHLRDKLCSNVPPPHLHVMIEFCPFCGVDNQTIKMLRARNCVQIDSEDDRSDVSASQEIERLAAALLLRVWLGQCWLNSNA